MKFNGIYDALYDYLKKVIESYEDEDITLEKTVNIEIMNIENSNGILIQKIGSNPIDSVSICGKKDLIFKFSIKSIQTYTPSDNINKLQIVQSLDKLGDYIEREYKSKRNIPILPFEYESNNIELLNSASVVESSEDRITAVIDLQFTYSTYY